MNQNNNGNNGPAAKVPFAAKAGYIGTGILIGLIVYPFVKKAVTKIQPQFDEILDGLTGKAEGLAERASDLMAKAKANLRRGEAPAPLTITISGYPENVPLPGRAPGWERASVCRRGSTQARNPRVPTTPRPPACATRGNTVPGPCLVNRKDFCYILNV